MHNPALGTCPTCGGPTEPAFCMRNAPLSFLSAADVQAWLHRDTDLSNRGASAAGKALDGLRSLLPWRAEYLLSYICRPCKLYMVQYGEVCSSAQAKELADGLLTAPAS